jgi:DNA-binding transcriptional MocR family regulator
MTNCMRLNFSHSSPTLIMDGIARLSKLVKEALVPEQSLYKGVSVIA